MSLTIIPSDYLFGIVTEKRELPYGWEYIEKGDDWLMIRDANGGMFYAGMKFMYPAIKLESGKFGCGEKIEYP